MRTDLRKFLIYSAIFLLPIICSIGYIESKLRGLENSYVKKQRIIESNSSQVEVLVLGSSHALHGIDPQFFDLKGINLANTSQSIFYDTAMVDRYAHQMPALKVVVFALSYFSLGYDLKDSEESWRRYWYWHFMAIKPGGLELDPKMFSYIALYSWPQTRQYLREGFRKALVVGLNPWGWQKPEEANSLARDQYGKNRVDFHHRLIHEKNFISNESHLMDTIMRLKKRGVRSIIVRMPASPNYLQFTSSKIHQRNISIIEKICHISACSILDGQSLGFGQEFFADDDHLNTQGAQKFSRLLNVQINKIRDQ